MWSRSKRNFANCSRRAGSRSENGQLMMVLNGIPSQHRLQKALHSLEQEDSFTLDLRILWICASSRRSLCLHDPLTRNLQIDEENRTCGNRSAFWYAGLVRSCNNPRKNSIQSVWLKQLEWDAPLYRQTRCSGNTSSRSFCNSTACA